MLHPFSRPCRVWEERGRGDHGGPQPVVGMVVVTAAALLAHGTARTGKRMASAEAHCNLAQDGERECGRPRSGIHLSSGDQLIQPEVLPSYSNRTRGVMLQTLCKWCRGVDETSRGSAVAEAGREWHRRKCGGRHGGGPRGRAPHTHRTHTAHGRANGWAHSMACDFT